MNVRFYPDFGRIVLKAGSCFPENIFQLIMYQVIILTITRYPRINLKLRIFISVGRSETQIFQSGAI